MQLAQLNIAQAKYDLDAPQIKDFVDIGCVVSDNE